MKWAVIVSEYQSGEQPMGILVDIEEGGATEALRVALEFVKKETSWNVRHSVVYSLNWDLNQIADHKKRSS